MNLYLHSPHAQVGIYLINYFLQENNDNTYRNT